MAASLEEPARTSGVKLHQDRMQCEADVVISRPAVIKGAISDWAASTWTPEKLSSVLGQHKLRYRIGRKRSGCDSEVQWEGKCQYVEASLEDFKQWQSQDIVKEDNPLAQFDQQEFWAYADYKYMDSTFADFPDLIKAVDWSVFGFPGRDGRDSTFWLGSEGAHTPCHQDTYGYNLVAQIYGRKKWILFPPSDSDSMYPTRIPYEESSIFSQVDIGHPDLLQRPRFQQARPFPVVLEPGDVLFVPRHWWHYVESLGTSISINTWLELPCDAEARLHEALTRVVVCSVMSHDQQDARDWLNPTEENTPHTTNMTYLKNAMMQYQEHLTFTANTDIKSPREMASTNTEKPGDEAVGEICSAEKDGSDLFTQCTCHSETSNTNKRKRKLMADDEIDDKRYKEEENFDSVPVRLKIKHCLRKTGDSISGESKVFPVQEKSFNECFPFTEDIISSCLKQKETVKERGKPQHSCQDTKQQLKGDDAAHRETSSGESDQQNEVGRLSKNVDSVTLARAFADPRVIDLVAGILCESLGE